TSNGYADGTAGATVTVNHPPASGPNAGNGNAVEVIITKLQPQFFAGIFGGSETVQARAVAILSSAGTGCIYVLRGNLSGDLTLHGGGRGGITTNPLCGLVVNNDMTVTGRANVDVSFASYAGNGPGGGSYPHGQPVHSVPGPDPCSRLAGCAYLATLQTTNPQLFSAPCQDSPANGGTLPANPLPPGHYCYGPYSSAVTLQSGLFIMDQGTFQGHTSGTGVTIYNNCTVSRQNGCSTTLNGGNVDDTIVAPLTGPTDGMVYYQPPSLQNSVTVNGAAGTVQAIGGVYAPGADFTLNGQLPTISFLVCGQITMNGGGLNAGSAGGFPIPQDAVLAE
ncbi:MAG: TadG family pilus assembly protein, partial [Vulcanimicrobiaceae bacterium]